MKYESASLLAYRLMDRAATLAGALHYLAENDEETLFPDPSERERALQAVLGAVESVGVQCLAVRTAVDLRGTLAASVALNGNGKVHPVDRAYLGTGLSPAEREARASVALDRGQTQCGDDWADPPGMERPLAVLGQGTSQTAIQAK